MCQARTVLSQGGDKTGHKHVVTGDKTGHKHAVTGDKTGHKHVETEHQIHARETGSN